MVVRAIMQYRDPRFFRFQADPAAFNQENFLRVKFTPKAHMQIERELGKNVNMQKLPDNQGAITARGLL